jgi:hypothetical protein
MSRTEHDTEPSNVSEADLTLRRLVLPNFEPRIKPADLEDFSSRDQRMLLAVSVIEQQLNFLVQQALAVNEHERRIEARLIKMERWRNSLSGPLAVLLWLATAALPFFIKQFFF